eukprot:5440127-Pyramimonas_sp.AAC.1
MMHLFKQHETILPRIRSTQQHLFSRHVYGLPLYTTASTVLLLCIHCIISGLDSRSGSLISDPLSDLSLLATASTVLLLCIHCITSGLDSRSGSLFARSVARSSHLRFLVELKQGHR